MANPKQTAPIGRVAGGFAGWYGDLPDSQPHAAIPIQESRADQTGRLDYEIRQGQTAETPRLAGNKGNVDGINQALGRGAAYGAIWRYFRGWLAFWYYLAGRTRHIVRGAFLGGV